jgi:hypothetical protein
MLSYLPVLMSPNDAGIISLIIFLASSVILGIPVLANRGSTQLLWAGVVGLVLTLEIAAMITIVALISNGTINWSFS